jgi:hypothetical protein
MKEYINRIKNNPVTSLIATFTILIVVPTAILPFFVPIPSDNNENKFDYYKYADYIGSISTSCALLWIMYNSTMQKRQIDMQKDELRFQNSILSRSAAASISQFYVMYFDEFEKALNRVSAQLYDLLIDNSKIEISMSKETNDEHLLRLSRVPKLSSVISIALQSDARAIIVSYLDLYVLVYDELRKRTREEDNTRGLFFVFEVSNPAFHIYNSIKNALNNNNISKRTNSDTVDESENVG